MTTHEHWLVCPLHVLWKYDAERLRDARSASGAASGRAVRRSSGGRPRLMERSLRHLDALICPSRSTRCTSTPAAGSRARMAHLPYFLPHDYTGLPAAPTPRHRTALRRGRGPAGEDQGVPGRHRRHAAPPGLDLRIAGSGQYEAALRDRGRGLANVHFEGRLDAAQVAALFRGARAVVVPSLVYETFGYVVLEAFAERTPVIVRDLGALPELVAESQGGLVFDSHEGLVAAIDRLVRRRRAAPHAWARTATAPARESGPRPSTSTATST